MKKSRFLTFILSFLPGCGLMYLGYMKKGLQVTAIFAASCFLAYLFGAQGYLEWIMVFFIILLPVIWFYQMFDSMHSVSRMKKSEIEVPTDDGFFFPQKLHLYSPAQNPAVAKVIAFVLIFLGFTGLVFGILDNLYNMLNNQIAGNIIYIIRNNITPAFISIVLIVIGFKLLIGNKTKKAINTDCSEKE